MHKQRLLFTISPSEYSTQFWTEFQRFMIDFKSVTDISSGWQEDLQTAIMTKVWACIVALRRLQWCYYMVNCMGNGKIWDIMNCSNELLTPEFMTNLEKKWWWLPMQLRVRVRLHCTHARSASRISSTFKGTTQAHCMFSSSQQAEEEGGTFVSSVLYSDFKRSFQPAFTWKDVDSEEVSSWI